MIHDEEVAKQVSDLMAGVCRRIEESLRLVQEKCSEEEFLRYQRAAASVMGYAYMDVLRPLYHEHPSLKPEGMD
jgi:hypothetical protein